MSELYLVTGAAGLIGGAVIRALNRRGTAEILAVDHLGTDEKWKNLRELQFCDYLEKDEFRKRLVGGRIIGIGGINMRCLVNSVEPLMNLALHFL